MGVLIHSKRPLGKVLKMNYPQRAADSPTIMRNNVDLGNLLWGKLWDRRNELDSLAPEPLPGGLPAVQLGEIKTNLFSYSKALHVCYFAFLKMSKQPPVTIQGLLYSTEKN